jgi:2,3-dihydroxybenzoate decarboxylase
MKGKLALEEAFAIPDTLGFSASHFQKEVWATFSKRMLDLTSTRFDEMDQYGIEMMILSLNSPGIQGIYKKKDAIQIAQKANDVAAEAVHKHHKRLRAFAALPLQDPDDAIIEMHRAIKNLGCVGVLVNGYSQIESEDKYVYLDDPIYRPFWAELEKLDVPFYLHPREAMPCNKQMWAGHPWLDGAAWAFGVETATHTLRLMCSGIFDQYPKLKFLLGHLGETLPFCISRTDVWIRKVGRSRGMVAQRPLSYYMCNNMWVTTSGHFDTAALWNTMMNMGSDRILFSVDYPFEEVKDACEWFDVCPISEVDRYKIGRQNIINLFKFDTCI